MSALKRVLVVDDEPGLRLMARAVLEDDGWSVSEAGSAEEALERLAGGQAVDVVLLDMRMPGMDGLEALGAISRAARGAPVVMLTAYGTVGSAVEAMKRGAFDYLTKPADNEEMKAVLAKALEYCRLVSENASLREQAAARGDKDMVGQTQAMQQVRELIDQAGPSEATVLITGESGTGKELVAQALHRASARADGPMVKVNIAALPHDLLESELFGYVRGAFTGAARDKPGRFQLARGGTLLLDEIGEMDMALQAKLLRVLQERMVEPLGSVRSEEVDVRILASTNRDLAAEVAAGRFREDLYFRLNVLEIRIPPLRERMEDLPCWSAGCWPVSRRRTTSPCATSAPGSWTPWAPIPGRATCASWRTPWSGRSSCRARTPCVRATCRPRSWPAAGPDRSGLLPRQPPLRRVRRRSRHRRTRPWPLLPHRPRHRPRHRL